MSSSLRRLVLCLLSLGAAGGLLSPSPARAVDADPWWGRDKALHFSISAGLAGAGYGATAAVAEDRVWRVPVGAFVALGAGAAKELYDSTGRGDPSWRDVTWDVIGTATGLGVAWLIDHWLRE